MRFFGRNQKQNIHHVEYPYEQERAVDAVAAPEGPFDRSSVKDVSSLVDLGSILVPVVDGMNLQLEMSEASGTVLSATITFAQTSIQLQAFAAPRSCGLWEEIQEQLTESLYKQKAEVGTREGRWGTELIGRMKAEMPDGSPGWRVARFVGVDGPRWFLRAVVAGQGAFDTAEASEVDEFLSRVVVDRGQAPMPPRELLPLKEPEVSPTMLDAELAAAAGLALGADTVKEDAGEQE